MQSYDSHTEGNKIYDRVFDSIKRYIIENHLKPGNRLPREVDMCKQLSVSRNTMREALKALQKLGIIEARPKEGMIIRAFNFDPIIENMEYSLMANNQQLVDLINLRITLEVAYLQEAMERATFGQLSRMSEIVDAMERKLDAGAPLLEEDMAFHLEMYALVDNALARDMIALFWRLLIQIQSGLKDIDFDPHPRDTVNIHRQILSLFSARELDACREVLTSHYSVRDRLRTYAMTLPADVPSRSLQCIMHDSKVTAPTLYRRIETLLRDQGRMTHRQLALKLADDPSFTGLTYAQSARKLSNVLQQMRQKGLVIPCGVRSGAVWTWNFEETDTSVID